MVLKWIKSLLSGSPLGSAGQFAGLSKPSRAAAEHPAMNAEAGIFARPAGLMGGKAGWSFPDPSIRFSAKAQKSKLEVPVPA